MTETRTRSKTEWDSRTATESEKEREESMTMVSSPPSQSRRHLPDRSFSGGGILKRKYNTGKTNTRGSGAGSQFDHWRLRDFPKSVSPTGRSLLRRSSDAAAVSRSGDSSPSEMGLDHWKLPKRHPARRLSVPNPNHGVQLVQTSPQGSDPSHAPYAHHRLSTSTLPTTISISPSSSAASLPYTLDRSMSTPALHNPALAATSEQGQGSGVAPGTGIGQIAGSRSGTSLTFGQEMPLRVRSTTNATANRSMPHPGETFAGNGTAGSGAGGGPLRRDRGYSSPGRATGLRPNTNFMFGPSSTAYGSPSHPGIGIVLVPSAHPQAQPQAQPQHPHYPLTGSITMPASMSMHMQMQDTSGIGRGMGLPAYALNVDAPAPMESESKWDRLLVAARNEMESLEVDSKSTMAE